MPRSNSPFITFQPDSEEYELLQKYCKQVDRNRTEVLRELIRGLEKRLKSD
jgi:hypothetical protein